MSRDHRKLTVFHVADALVLDIYKRSRWNELAAGLQALINSLSQSHEP